MCNKTESKDVIGTYTARVARESLNMTTCPVIYIYLVG